MVVRRDPLYTGIHAKIQHEDETCHHHAGPLAVEADGAEVMNRDQQVHCLTLSSDPPPQISVSPTNINPLEYYLFHYINMFSHYILWRHDMTFLYVKCSTSLIHSCSCFMFQLDSRTPPRLT